MEISPSHRGSYTNEEKNDYSDKSIICIDSNGNRILLSYYQEFVFDWASFHDNRNVPSNIDQANRMYAANRNIIVHDNTDIPSNMDQANQMYYANRNIPNQFRDNRDGIDY